MIFHLRHHRWLVMLAFGVAVVACRTRERTRPAPPNASAVAPASGRPYFVKAPARLETAQPFLKEQMSSARAAGERVLVYVGASWCEPCERFHDAVEAGELDAMLAGTRFVEFDADRHTEALGAAGYAFRMI
ncbi:MAG TPA: thioredoxin family protein, partial [Polyangiaceae bacterium]